MLVKGTAVFADIAAFVATPAIDEAGFGDVGSVVFGTAMGAKELGTDAFIATVVAKVGSATEACDKGVVA